MKKYKIALLTNIPSPYRIPLFEKLAKKIDIFIYFMASSEGRRGWKPKVYQGFTYKILPDLAIGFQNKATQESFSFHTNPTLAFELLKRPYDVMIIGGFASLSCYTAFLFSKIKRKPVILWIGNTLQDEPSTLRKIALPLIKLLMEFSNAFVVYGTRSKEYVMSFGIPTEKVFIAVNVGNVDFFMKESERLKRQKRVIKRQLKIKSKKVILYVGQLIERKGVKYLAEAFAKLKGEEKGAGLVLVGDGPQRNELMRRYQGVEDIYDAKNVQPEDLPPYYAIADVFILPSLYDRFGIVVSEAMASGLPIIATEKVGASADLVRNGVNGYVVKDRDADGFYEASRKILKDPQLSWWMGENSRRMIENEFNLDKMAQGFIEAIEYVIKTRI